MNLQRLSGMHSKEQVPELIARLGSADDVFFSLLEFPGDIQPALLAAYDSEGSDRIRATIVEVAWQRREPSCFQMLRKAIADPADPVWKEALNGLATFATQESLDILLAARASASVKLQEWIDEAVDQVRANPNSQSRQLKMTPKTIRLFVKPYCGWCSEAESWFKSRGWDYERLDVTNDRAARQEMIDLTGQSRAPSAEIDGHVIADFDTDQLEHFLKQNGYSY